MAENQTELKQQDVFSYIDRELKKDRKSFAERIVQKTKSNFLIVLMVNLIAIFIASVGFYTVYTIFSERAYNLVGSEKSIKGLQDVLFAEMQKKANAELLKQQEEMKKIQAELNKLNNQMEDYKTAQQKLLKAELEKNQNELKAKLEAESKNKTEAEKEELKKQYQLEIAAQQKAIEQASKQKDQEYQKQLQSEKQKLLDAEQNKKEALTSAQNQLNKAQSELQTLQEEKAKTAAVLKEFETAKEDQKKIDAFNDQVAMLFQSAISSFQSTKYDIARQNLNGVLKLYDNKPAGVGISKARENVDKFLVSAIADYLALKESKAGETQAQYSDMIIALKDLRDLAKDLNGGAYANKGSALKSKLAQYQNTIPDVYAFANAYERYFDTAQKSQPSVLDLSVDQANANATPVFNAAKSLYNGKSYDSAIKNFKTVIAEYPNSKYTKEALGYIDQIYKDQIDAANGSGVNLDSLKSDQTKNSGGSYSSAKKYEKEGDWAKAQQYYTRVITEYPLSAYVNKSVEGLQNAISEIAKKDALESGGSLDKIIADQNQSAQPLIANADKQFKNGKFTDAQKAYSDLIINYPLSKYTGDSLDGFQKSIEKTEQGKSAGTVDLTEMKKAQNKDAKDLYAKAAADEKAGKLDSAKTKYSKVITDYPLSDYVEGGMTGYGNIVAKQEQGKSAGTVDLTEMKKTQNKDAKDLYAKAVADEKAGKLDSAKTKYMQVITDYPLSDYVQGGLTGYGNIVAKQEQGKSAGTVDLTEMKKAQNKDAKDLYAKASADEKGSKYGSAKEKYAQIITSYPLSDYVEGSVNGIERVVALEEKSKSTGAVDLTKIKSDQNAAAKSIFTQAGQSENAKNYTDAKTKYIGIITAYPLSDYVKDSVDGLERVVLIEGAKSAGLSIAELKAQHNKSAKEEFAKAEDFLKKNDFVKAKQSLIAIMTQYPLSDYIDKSIEKLEFVVIQQNKETQQQNKVQEENYLEKAIGRVIDAVGNEIILDVYKGKSLTVGQSIFIYRKDEKGGIIYIGEAAVSVVSPIMSKAKVVKKNEPIKVGDILYRK
jgi:outer membrane protein assembly factor BamD (BamD/ComL family)